MIGALVKTDEKDVRNFNFFQSQHVFIINVSFLGQNPTNARNVSEECSSVVLPRLFSDDSGRLVLWMVSGSKTGAFWLCFTAELVSRGIGGD